MAYRPQEVADKLGISPSTLRLWSNRFASALSDQARKIAPGGAGTAAQRRYRDEDLETLIKAKELLSQGLTYEETKRRLRQAADPRPADPQPPESPPAPALNAQDMDAFLASLRETLEAKDKTIAALKESLAFLDVYLRTVLQEREDARTRERLLQREVAELRASVQEMDQEVERPWWRRLLALP
ncbi:MAG: MerR family transcriptional regulator [Chloroflexota bacterium]